MTTKDVLATVGLSIIFPECSSLHSRIVFEQRSGNYLDRKTNSYLSLKEFARLRKLEESKLVGMQSRRIADGFNEAERVRARRAREKFAMR